MASPPPPSSTNDPPPVDLRLEVTPGSAVPLYRQITQQIRLAIATQRATSGMALPSVRALAEQLVVNPNTVAKAYAELTRDGVLVSQPGRGVFINQPTQRFTDAERQRRLDAELEALVHTCLEMGVDAAEVAAALQHKFAQLGLISSPEASSTSDPPPSQEQP